MSIPAAQAGSEGDGTFAAARATVLVVDDEPAVRRLFVTALTRAGYRAYEAGNGREALTVFERHADSIDLVLTDLRMPVMDGLALTRELRAQRPSLKVICVSGYVEDVAAVPGVHFLAKPVSRATLLTKVQEALR